MLETLQTAQIENSSAEMIRYYLSLIPEAFKFVWAHVKVAENTPQSSNFERTVAMHLTFKGLGWTTCFLLGRRGALL